MAEEFWDLKIVALDRVHPRVSLAALLQGIRVGRVARTDLVRQTGAADWLPVGQVPSLAGGFVRTPALETPPTEEELERELDAGHVWVPPRSKRRAEEAEMDMTPMIDVTFQLLIFFMLTNQLANPAPIAVPEAVHGRGVSPEGTQMVLIDELGKYYLGDKADESTAAASLDALIQEVTVNARGNDQPLDVIVNAEKTSKYLHLRPLVERLGRVPNVGRVLLGVEEARQRGTP